MSIMLAVLIVFFCSTASTLSVSAEEVTSSSTYDTEYFRSLLEQGDFDISQATLSDLPVNQYHIVMLRHIQSNSFEIFFMPKDNSEFVFYDNTYLDKLEEILVKNYPVVIDTASSSSIKYFKIFAVPNTKIYTSVFSSNGITNTYERTLPDTISTGNFVASRYATSNNGNDLYDIYVSDPSLYNLMNDTGLFSSNEAESATSMCSVLRYSPNLFASLASIFGGYTGEILDTSVSGLLSEKGIDAPSTIYDDYKNKLYYMQNNDLSMVFMNNAEAPSYKKEDYDGIYEGAKKYTFTYAKTYDVIVFFPQYQKYLKFDDWWNANAKGGIDWGAWGNLGIIDVIISTNDKSKTFYLTSDWDVTFNDTGGVAYSGTRVIMSWDSEYGETLDSNTMMKPWEDNSEELKNKGWLEGRPNDMSYPYCVQYYLNGVPSTYIYFNSKPKVNVCRYSDTKCSYSLEMVGTYGYIYDVISDMYYSFDLTMDIDIGNAYSNTTLNELAHYMNNIYENNLVSFANLSEDGQLTIWENYKGDENSYIGSKIFFNWNIRSNWSLANTATDDFDYTKVFLTEGNGYIDNNGNGHGGDTDIYSDEELNKYNDNGNKEENNNSASSDSFNFTSEGIFAYCGEFFNFIKYIFDLFPAWIWLIIGTFITVLIMLRVLGR